MTFKLWLLSIVISTFAPSIMAKCNRLESDANRHDNHGYTPGQYFDHTQS